MISSSRSSPTNSQSSSTEVQNLNLQDTAGITLANSSGINISTSDAGAISAAVDISGNALDLGREALRSGSDVAIAGLDNAKRAYEGGLDFGRDAIDAVGQASERIDRFAGDALDSNAGLVAQAFDFAAGLFGDALGAQQKTVDTNLQGLTGLAVQTSSSADDRVSKVAMYAFAAIAAVFVLPALLGKLK